MESERFDALTRRLGRASGRRAAIKGLLGLGVASMVGLGAAGESDAARRGFSGPKLPTPEPTPACPLGACSETCPCGEGQVCVDGGCFLSCAVSPCPCGLCFGISAFSDIYICVDVNASVRNDACTCAQGSVCLGGSCYPPCFGA